LQINPVEDSKKLGYSAKELQQVPKSANMGLGCGNPLVFSEIQKGEIVLDLGSGGGLDCFIASKKVGAKGRVIGVDMTPEMLSKAREAAEKHGYKNVEFRLGEIEHLPVADNSVDLVISNCVINLSPDKTQVYREALRALKPGGRICISDVVRIAEMPKKVKGDSFLLSCCVSGAASSAEINRMLKKAGFVEIEVAKKSESRDVIKDWVPGTRAEDYVVSAIIRARKPRKR
jgi:ubiquinone/menaquinone biosynthesis C-methylase UbiE